MNEIACTAMQYFDTIASFEQAAEQLAAADPVMLDSREVLEGLRRLEAAARKIPYAQHVLARVAFEQGLPGQLDYTGLKELLVDQLRLAGSEARDRMRGAVERAPRHERGVAPEPLRALTAAAQRAGAISDRHAVVINTFITRSRRLLNGREMEELEDILVTAAYDVSPDDLGRVGRRALELIDPDGTEPSADAIARARGLDVGKQGDDLLSEFDGALTPTARALLDVVLEKLARPGVNNPADSDAPVDLSDSDAVAEAAKRDTRTQSQRNHDALEAALRAAISSGQLGQHRGMPCVPIITLGIDQLESESGMATTATGGRIPVEDALHLMGANPKYVLVLDLASRPLFLGREKRLATTDQRIALYGSDKGCTAPGCDAPATRCQVHHITEWADGGATDITLLTLACDTHHGRVTPSTSDYPRGFETIVIPHGEHAGRSGWLRKADPTGRYRVNYTHHPDELYRQALARWRQRCEQFQKQWRAEHQRAQYQYAIGPVYADITSILDGPNGPPILEDLLAEHDAQDPWGEVGAAPQDDAA